MCEYIKSYMEKTLLNDFNLYFLGFILTIRKGESNKILLVKEKCQNIMTKFINIK